MKESKKTKEKKALALEVIARLKQEYPHSDCTLDYNEAWKLLVSVRLAAQCTDARVNVVVQGLYEKFPTVAALAAADVSEIEEIVKPCGLGHSKARDISACMQMLHEKYDDKVPDDFDKLLKLPGVGREREPDYGGCVWKACNCDGYALHSSDKPDWACGRDEGAEEGGNGTVGDYSARGGE